MKRKTSTTNKKHALPLLTAAMILIIATLTGCSSAEEPTSGEGANASIESTVETVQPTEEVVVSSEAEIAPEPTVEATPEPTPEVVVYEGIDMESTLPGAEWIATFEGVINEPKIVVYNDATNKKVIVENGEEVEFAADDTLAIYTAGAKVKEYTKFVFKNELHESSLKFSELSVRYKSGDNIEYETTLELNGEEIVYKITVNVQ